MWGAKPPTFLKAFPGPRGWPDLKNAPQEIRPDCLQVHNMNYSKSRNTASGLIKFLPSRIFGPILGSILSGSGPKMCPQRAGALLEHTLGPDPNGTDPKIGPKIGPGRILIKPEALLRDIE